MMKKGFRNPEVVADVICQAALELQLDMSSFTFGLLS